MAKLNRLDSNKHMPTLMRPMTAKHLSANQKFGRFKEIKGILSSENVSSITDGATEPKIISANFNQLKQRANLPPTAPKRIGSALIPKLDLKSKPLSSKGR
jgi:hypothetical protein